MPLCHDKDMIESAITSRDAGVQHPYIPDGGLLWGTGDRG